MTGLLARIFSLCSQHARRTSAKIAENFECYNFNSAARHIRQVKNGKLSTHPISGDELRALRKLTWPEEEPVRRSGAASTASDGGRARFMLGLACGERGSVLDIRADYCFRELELSLLSALSRHPIRQLSLTGLLKKPNAPASSTRFLISSSGNAVMKMIGVR